jgi:hypothetical protein
MRSGNRGSGESRIHLQCHPGRMRVESPEIHRRGLRVRRPIRPPESRFVWPESDETDRLGTTAWTWHRHTPRAAIRPRIRTGRTDALPTSAGGAETIVGVTVRRGVPVTVRRADVRRLVVERPAPDQARVWSSPSGTAFYETGHSAGDRCRRAGRGRSNS